MQYKPLLEQAWRQTVRNPFLWWFGLLAYFIRTSGTDFDPIFQAFRSFSADDTIVGLFYSIEANQSLDLLANNLNIFFERYDLFGWLILIAVALFFVGLLWVISLAQSGIYATAAQLPGNKKNKVHFWQTLAAGNQHVWTVFAINLLQKSIIILLIFIAALPLIILGPSEISGINILGYLSVTFFIVVPLSILLQFWTRYAQLFSVVRKQHLLPAIREAWTLLRKEWLITLETSIIFFIFFVVGSTVLGMVITLLTFSLRIIVANLGIFSANVETAVTIVLAILETLLAVAVGAIFISAYQTFESVSWTHLFQKLTTEKRWSKLHQVLHPIVGSGHREPKKVRGRRKKA